MAQPVSPDDHDNKHHHIIPVSLLAKVFGALVFLTVLTVVTAEYVDLGALNVPLALAIAAAKASLVVTFFMALKYDNRVNTLVFSVGAIFVVVFLSFTLLDTTFRGDLGNVSEESTFQQERRAERIQARLDSLNDAAAGTDAGAAATGSALADSSAVSDSAASDSAASDSAASE